MHYFGPTGNRYVRPSGEAYSRPQSVIQTPAVPDNGVVPAKVTEAPSKALGLATEDGFGILCENGNRIVLESCPHSD